jgi:hypothetical protein
MPDQQDEPKTLSIPNTPSALPTEAPNLSRQQTTSGEPNLPGVPVKDWLNDKLHQRQKNCQHRWNTPFTEDNTNNVHCDRCGVVGTVIQTIG